MGSSKTETTLAIKALKNIDINRSKVTPKKDFSKKSHQTQLDPFDANEDEDTDSGQRLTRSLGSECFRGLFRWWTCRHKDMWSHGFIAQKLEPTRKWQENKRKNWFPNERIVLE
jgi:hypothetical protein